MIEVSRVRETLERSFEMMMAAQAKQMAGAPHMKTVLEEFYREHSNWTVLEPEYMTIYLETFSEAEARDLTAFYQTPLGKMMLDKMPIMMSKTQEVASARMQRAMPDLIKRMEAALPRPDPTPH